MTARALGVAVLGLAGFVAAALAQPPDGPPPFGPKGRGGPGGFMGPERKVLKQFDADKNGWLNTDERKAARESLKASGGGRPGRGFGPGGGRFQDPPKPGAKVAPADVTPAPDRPLYDPTVLRTLFLDFESPDWEQELEDFHGTDVDVPATLTVDGKTYRTVGVHFRGMSSYMGVPAGYKRSLNVALDLADRKQRLYGSRTLNLLNAHGDPSFLSTVLYSHVARQYIPAPKANLVRVVINGESWGVYCSAQQFDREFLSENFKTTKGARWKVRGSPGGRGGLEYLGDRIEDYKRVYEIKSKDDDKDWKALVNLCKVLNETPPEKLEAALAPLVDLDNLLWFLALDVALVNSDGYWTRASDYSLYLDPKGKFHFIPHDMNEAFRTGGPGMGGPMFARKGPGGPGGPPGGPGDRGGPPGGRGGPGGPDRVIFGGLPRPGEILPPPVQDTLGLTDDQKKQLADLQKDLDGKLEAILTEPQRKQLKEIRDRPPMVFGAFGPGGPGGGGTDLDPLVGLTNARMPLRSKLLAVPALKARYLANVRTIAEKSLDWKALGPVVAQYRTLVEKEIEADTRKLSTVEAFRRATADSVAGSGREASLRAFAEQRRKYLLDYKEGKVAAAKGGTP